MIPPIRRAAVVLPTPIAAAAAAGASSPVLSIASAAPPGAAQPPGMGGLLGGDLPPGFRESPPRPLRVVLIPNRGDPAIRAIRAVREFNRKYGTEIKVAVIHSSVDHRDDFVRMADFAFEVPPAHQAEAVFTEALSVIADGQEPDEIVETSRAEICGILEAGIGRDPAFCELYLDTLRTLDGAGDYDALDRILRGAIEKSRKPTTSYLNIPWIL